MSDDPVFRWVDRVILDLHFDACHFQKDKEPGKYRQRGIEVANPDGGRAAMAHLHVVSVHPFRDGNGRISRIVQSLVLAREGHRWQHPDCLVDPYRQDSRT